MTGIAEVTMLPLRKTQVGNKIKENGFNPNDFDLIPFSNDWFEIRYKPFPAFFLKINNTVHELCPGQSGRLSVRGETRDWNRCLFMIEYWLKGLKENLDIDDPWASASNLGGFAAGSFLNGTAPLTRQQQVVFEQSLELVVRRISELGQLSDQIKSDVELLVGASKVEPAKSVALMFLGAFVSWVWSGFIPSDQVPLIWQYIQELFNNGIKMIQRL